jgi:hypothetical protein
VSAPREITPGAQPIRVDRSMQSAIGQDGLEQFNREMDELTAGPREWTPEERAVASAATEKKIIPLPDVSPQARRDARSRRSDLRNLDIDASEVKRTVARPPMEQMPRVMRRFVEESAASFQMPVEMALPFALGAVAGAIGNRRSIRVKNAWYESPALWLAVVARPGAGKSPLMKHMLAPIYQWESERAAEHEALVKAMEADNTEKSLRRSEIPAAMRAVVSDVTIERLALLFQQNPRGLLLARDELSAFAQAMGQYKSSRGADRSEYLSMWAGAPITVDRKRDEETIRVEHPCLTVIGGTQPGRVKELASDNGDDGYMDRMLGVYAEPGARSWDTPDVSVEASENWEEMVGRLLEMKMQPSGSPVAVTMNDEARARYGELYNRHFTTQARPDFPYRMYGVWAKLEVYAARLTLGLHMARLASGETTSEDVEVNSVEGAWALVNWFGAHGRVIRGLLNEKPEDRIAGALMGWLKAHGGEATLREIVRARAVGIRSHSQAQDALDMLVDRELVLKEERSKNSLVYRALTPEGIASAA